MQELREAIRAAMEGRRQEDVAEAMNVSQPKVSRWLRGQNEPSFEEIARLEDVCAVPRGFIFGAVGVLPVTTVREAVAMDPHLDDAGRGAVLAVYDALAKAEGR